ncbi:DUF992 domain-containing protein [Ensifer sp. SL37]|uniref:DUF992 domain-containing protein n=1 Tax=Ensifer sp. SL37 TaxID=2995137 RepID=UPI0022749840|nr:DUF992 domain-containing protein [Ensifer sp. SL37]MCY1740547.1 DUF992 domain-containing protein [Ensifer sp. SL37]
MRNVMNITAIVLAGLVVATQAQAGGAKPSASDTKRKAGVLECEVAGGIGLILGSSKKVSCTFEHASGWVEGYSGTISKLGLDVGVTSKSYLAWAVVPSGRLQPGEFVLEGSYVGASAGASVIVGLGANALVGGSNKSVVLQPFSAEGTQGLNVAVGISQLNLKRVGEAETPRPAQKPKKHKAKTGH